MNLHKLILFCAAASLITLGIFGCDTGKTPKKNVVSAPTVSPAITATKDDSQLFEAARNGKAQLVKKLLAAHASANARGEGYASHSEGGEDKASGHSWTALMIASYNHHKEIAELLLSNGADVNAKSEAGLTALYYACQANEPNIANLLLDYGAEVNVRYKTGATPHYWAISYELTPLSIRLIEQGADANATSTETGQTVLMAAYANKLPLVGDLLLAKGADVHRVNKKDGETALMQAAANNYYQSVERLIEQGADLNAIARQSYTALAFASGNDSDDIRIPALLIEKGATINFTQDIGFTALMEAAISRNIRIATLLIAKGADVNAVSISRGKVTALKDAVFACDFELSRLLVAHGAHINAVTENGSSILLEAVWNEKNLALVSYLIEKGADVNLANEDGETPLLKSVSYKDAAMAKLLLEHGANPGARDVYGNSVYSRARESGNESLIRLINRYQ